MKLQLNRKTVAWITLGGLGLISLLVFLMQPKEKTAYDFIKNRPEDTTICLLGYSKQRYVKDHRDAFYCP